MRSNKSVSFLCLSCQSVYRNVANLGWQGVRSRSWFIILLKFSTSRGTKTSSCHSSSVVHSCSVSSWTRLERLFLKLFLIKPASLRSHLIFRRRSVSYRLSYSYLCISVGSRPWDILLPDVISSVCNNVQVHHLTLRGPHCVSKWTGSLL